MVGVRPGDDRRQVLVAIGRALAKDVVVPTSLGDVDALGEAVARGAEHVGRAIIIDDVHHLAAADARALIACTLAVARRSRYVFVARALPKSKGWAKLIIAQEFSEVSIDGYTGRHGRSEAYYKKLSTSRAKAVKNYLVNAIKGHGLSVKYTWAGHGSKHPIASNKTLAGSIKNQRVEVTLR